MMSKPDFTFAIRRILVALDASPQSLAALDAAVNLAAKLDAEILGLFVEDAALLGLSEIPYAREVLYFSSAEAPVTRASMESRLKAQSEQARKSLEAAAERAQITWSFRTARGRVTSEVLAASAGVDLLALGKGGWSLGSRIRIGSTAMGIVESSLPVFLLPERGVPENAHLLVYYDSSPAAQRGLLAAAMLARAGMDGIAVLVESRNKVDVKQVEKEIDALLDGGDIQIRYLPFDASNEENLLRLLKGEKNGVLVLGGRELLDKLPSLDTLLRETELPLMILGSAPTS